MAHGKQSLKLSVCRLSASGKLFREHRKSEIGAVMAIFVKRNSVVVRTRVLAAACIVSVPLTGCQSLGASGPSSGRIASASKQTVANSQIQVIDVTYAVARRVLAADHPRPFSEALGDAPPTGSIIGRGDVLQVSIWEAPPAVLFGTNTSFGAAGANSSLLATTAGVGLKSALPDMMVDDQGFIQVPFAGPIRAAGRSPRQVEQEIRARLAGKAHDPQVSVQISTNASSDVTVVGDVATNTRVPLTPKGERLLDVIASAGGVKQPIGKVTVQISREGQIANMPLEAVIRDPAQNIRLAPNDVVTAYYQPFSFTALGATGVSTEINFEGTGVTLAQALGRVGGLKDDRANVRGAFIFRLEDPAALDPAIAARATRTLDGRVPVIYRIDMSNPATFFVAQNFPMRDKDILYVSTAPLTDFQRFFGLVSSMTFSLIGLTQSIP
jgi:polysaccharide biosynthesis/export protein